MSAYGIEWQSNDLSQWVDNDNAQWDGLALTSRFKAQIGIVDATLTDFPVTLNISEASGVGANDLTRFFDSLAYTLTGDTFTGENGDLPDADIWIEEANTYGNATIQSNALNFNSESEVGDDTMEYWSKFVLSGDFDIQIDCNPVTVDQPASGNIYAGLLEFSNVQQAESGVWGQLLYYRRSSDGGYLFAVQGSSTGWDTAVESKLDTKLRFTRVGSTIKAYYHNGAAWEFDGAASKTMSESTTDDIYVSIWAKCYASYDLEVNFDNFTITSGTVEWPEGAHPHRKKIAVTTSDGQTQCPVEIEHFDILNEVAVLHTKVPSVSALEFTILYVHYSADQINNTAYVGDTGDTAAQNVWDSDFEAVYHLAQDPSGGAGCMLDSTTNARHMSTVGSMTSADLIDGPNNSKAIDFDGGDDGMYVNAAAVSAFPFTLEGFASRDASVNHNVLTAICDKDVGDEQAGIAIWGDDKLLIYDYTTAAGFVYDQSAFETAQDVYYHVAGVYTDSTDKALFVNGTNDGNLTTSSAFPDGVDRLTIGYQGDSSPGNYIDGKIADIRISSVARADAWIKATYQSLYDTLITYYADFLEDWTSRARFTVDSDLVDADLTNFPIALPISSSCGIGTDDMTAIFDGLAFTGDTFTGDDGDPPSTDLWALISETNSGDLSIQSNQLNFDPASAGTLRASNYGSVFDLSGDFDIQTDFVVTTLTTPSSGVSYAVNLQLYSGATNIAYVSRAVDSSAKQGYTSGGNSLGYNLAYSYNHSSAKLRITRSGSTVKVFHRDTADTQWEWDGNAAGRSVGSSSDDLQVRMYFEQDTGGTVLSDVDNFTINSGSIIWSEGTNPHRKKIAVTTSDGVTECYAEIEFFDIANEMALLHAKVPLISSSIDTEFFLYYDNTHFNNTDRIGDAGDTPAQLVWDSDFGAVYHLAQDPSGGAGCILDSTDNGNDGTPAGSMTTADLVAGQVSGAKAIDFDESDDSIACGQDTSLDFASRLTMESVFSRDVAGGTSDGICGRYGYSGGDLRQYAMYVTTTDNELRFVYGTNSGATGHTVTSNETFLADGFHHAVAAWDKALDSGKFFLFKDGAECTYSASDDETGDISTGEAIDFSIGGYDSLDSADLLMGGKIGEIRLSKIRRSDAWIKATYHALFDTFGTWDAEAAVDVYAVAGTPAQITWSVYSANTGVGVAAGTPAQIAWSPQAATVSVSVPAGTPAQIAWSVLSAGVNVAVLASTPSIAWSALAATITQNLNAIGIVSKPTVSASKPTVTATGRQPLASATSAKPSITVTVKAPFVEATLAGPSITVTSKGD
jgi:hypothetical protein